MILVDPLPQPPDLRRSSLIEKLADTMNPYVLQRSSVSKENLEGEKLGLAQVHNTSNADKSLKHKFKGKKMIKEDDSENIDTTETYSELRALVSQLQKQLTNKTIQYINQQIILRTFFPPLENLTRKDITPQEIHEKDIQINSLKRTITHLRKACDIAMKESLDYQKSNILLKSKVQQLEMQNTYVPENIKKKIAAFVTLQKKVTDQNLEIHNLKEESSTLRKALDRFDVPYAPTNLENMEKGKKKLKYSILPIIENKRYRPIKNDPVDQLVAAFTNSRSNKVMLTRLKKGLYLFGQLLLQICQENDQPVVVYNSQKYTLFDFVELYEEREYNVLQSQANQNPYTSTKLSNISHPITNKPHEIKLIQSSDNHANPYMRRELSKPSVYESLPAVSLDKPQTLSEKMPISSLEMKALAFLKELQSTRRARSAMSSPLRYTQEPNLQTNKQFNDTYDSTASLCFPSQNLNHTQAYCPMAQSTQFTSIIASPPKVRNVTTTRNNKGMTSYIFAKNEINSGYHIKSQGLSKPQSPPYHSIKPDAILNSSRVYAVHQPESSASLQSRYLTMRNCNFSRELFNSNNSKLTIDLNSLPQAKPIYQSIVDYVPIKNLNS